MIRVIICVCYCLLCSLNSEAKTNYKDVSLYSAYLDAMISAYKGDYRVASEKLDSIIKKDSRSYHLREQSAILQFSLGNVENARKQLFAAKSIDPDRLAAYWGLLSLYEHSQDYEALNLEYESFLKKAYEKYPNERILIDLGDLYFSRGDFKNALKLYRDVLKIDPLNDAVLFKVGLIKSDNGQVADAINLWEVALARNPNNANILNALGYTYVEEGIKIDRAKELIEQALIHEPNNGAFTDSLGWYYYKKKDYVNAEIILLKAISLERDPVIYEHLGDLYIQLGDRNKAEGFFQRGLFFFPNSKKLKLKIEKYGFKN